MNFNDYGKRTGDFWKFWTQKYKISFFFEERVTAKSKYEFKNQTKSLIEKDEKKSRSRVHVLILN